MGFIKTLAVISLVIISTNAKSSLSVRNILTTKKNVYVEHAIFQSGSLKQNSELSSLRHSSYSKRGYERIVLDFESKNLPETYVFVSSRDGKINIDLSNTKIKKSVKPTIKSNFIREVNFFPLANNILSMEIFVDKKVYAEVFQLKAPTRLVIDLKK